jgi:exo-beta-1,3-glucanase (GH17 family)
MPVPVSLFSIASAAIVAMWWWLGSGVPMPPSPLAPGEKLHCVSYAPFRGNQSPFDLSTKIERWQIEEDLALLSKVTDCVRTYSVDFGLEQVPEIARKHGLEVMLGLWVSSHTDRTKLQIDTGVALAKQYPDVIRAVVVGNEALLRGEISPHALGELIRGVKSQVSMPVTYADVWEFWLRHRELSNLTDFVTVHILPYWEDEPIPASHAADHIASIRRKVADAFAGKEIFLGEVGWPSRGRMREGALPSPANQALVVHDLMTHAKSERFNLNIIEAFDEPWKRWLEGTVGGYWGLITDVPRQPKFSWGEPVSNHPRWLWQALAGVLFGGCCFGAAHAARRRSPPERCRDGWVGWGAVAITAAVGGALLGWTVEAIWIESLGVGGWLRSLAFLLAAVLAPLIGAAALMRRVQVPSFSEVIGPPDIRVRDSLGRTLGLCLILLTVLALHAALGLSFNPRYLDFPFAPLTAALVPFLLLSVMSPPAAGRGGVAERVAGAVLVLCAIYIVWNETLHNWQAVWFGAALGLLAFILARARGARS